MSYCELGFTLSHLHSHLLLSLPLSLSLSHTHTHSAVPSAPVGVAAERVSATEVRVQWPLVKADLNSPILHYTVKYYAFESDTAEFRRRELNLKLIDTKTNLTIDGLDPALTYSVSVAASSASGTGQFSEEISVGCKYASTHCYYSICGLYLCNTVSENSLFQLFLSGEIDCQEWVVSSFIYQ